MLNVYSRARDGETLLSRSFRAKEFACKDGTDPLFVDSELVQVLQAIRDHFGAPVVITSGYRTAVLLLALTNQVLSALGKPMLPIESQTVEQLVTAGITTVAALISWWNNNSFTSAAIQADAEYARLKQKSE